MDLFGSTGLSMYVPTTSVVDLKLYDRTGTVRVPSPTVFYRTRISNIHYANVCTAGICIKYYKRIVIETKMRLNVIGVLKHILLLNAFSISAFHCTYARACIVLRGVIKNWKLNLIKCTCTVQNILYTTRIRIIHVRFEILKKLLISRGIPV